MSAIAIHAAAQECAPGRGAPRLKSWARAFAVALLALLALFATPVTAQTFPAFTGLVTDAANVLPADRKAALEAKLEAFQKKTGRQLVVATVPDLGGDDVDSYGYKLGRAWGIGLKGANDGTLLFVAPNEPKGQRGPRIDAGPGVQGVLTDAYSSVIINTQMMPKLSQNGDIAGALDAGSDAIIDILSQPDDQARAKEQAAVAAYDKERKHEQSGGIPIALIFWVIVIGWVFIGGLIQRRGHGRAYGGSSWPIFLWGLGSGSWGSGGSSGGSSFGGGSNDGGGSGWMGGGFTGGGGGSFDGGGASGNW